MLMYSENLARLVPQWAEHGVPEHSMLGTTVEDQKRADERIPEVLRYGRRHFLSCEPLLGPIDLHLDAIDRADDGQAFYRHDVEAWHPCDYACGEEIQGGIDWVICGSESGHPGKVRETRDEWVASLRDQCAAAGVPFFIKQLQNPEKVPGRVVSLPLFQGERHRGQP